MTKKLFKINKKVLFWENYILQYTFFCVQQVKPSNPHEEQEVLDGIDKVYYNTEGIDTSHYELRVRIWNQL